MPVAFYPQIKINSLYLTATAANGGTPYIAIVRGLDALAVDSSIQVTKSLNGTPYIQIADMAGYPISIEFPNLLSADFDSIRDIIQAYITSGTSISMDITGGDYGDFTSLGVVPDENPIRFGGEFQNGRILGASFHFLTT